MGVLFVLPVISTAFLFDSVKFLYMFLAMSSALIVFGFFVSPEGDFNPALMNRGISLFVLWFSGFFCHLYIKKRNSIERFQRQFEHALEAAPNGMVMVDQNGKIVLANDQSEVLFGYDKKELLGQSVEVLVPERFRKEHPQYRKNYLMAPRPRSMGTGRDLFGLRKDGSEFPVEIGLNPIKTEEGDLIISSIIDISDRRRYIEELERANDQLDNFAYIASHDLKEPLRGIQSQSIFLQEDYANILDEKGKERLNRLQLLSSRMQDLLDRLLEFSRLGRSQLKRKETNVASLLEEVQENLSSRIKENNVTISLEGEIPMLRVDPILFVEVLSNLVSNGIKYNDKKKKTIKIGYQNKELYVLDNGIGIEKKDFYKVFQLFKRVHGKDEYGGGAGAGLTIVRKIVEYHQEKIRIESVVGRETKFFISLNNSLT